MGRAGGSGGGRRGGSFGGSRSGSFGGGRSGSFGGSSRSNGRYSSSKSYRGNSSSYIGWGRSYMPRGPIIINNSGNKNYTPSGNNQNYPQKSENNDLSNGCLHIALIFIMVVSLILTLFNTVGLLNNKDSSRTKLEADIIETEYYTDKLGWIDNDSVLIDGMKYFYKKTGVQPYLYITDDIGGDFNENAEVFANNLYDELFADEAHLLLIFCENDGYDTYCLSGQSAKTVIDSVARSTLLDIIDENYYNSSYDDNEYFSKSFKQAANRIMNENKVSVATVIIPLIVFIISLSAEVLIKKKVKKDKREKELKEMLEKPLETFGDTKIENLAKKYEKSETDIVPTEESDKCLSCGADLKDDSNFCSNCGDKID